MRLFHLLKFIRRNLKIVEEADFSRVGYYAILHSLQPSSQSLIDMASLVSSSLGRPPSSFYEAGEFLAEEGVFSEDDLRKYRGIVGFRNVLETQLPGCGWGASEGGSDEEGVRGNREVSTEDLEVRWFQGNRSLIR